MSDSEMDYDYVNREVEKLGDLIDFINARVRFALYSDEQPDLPPELTIGKEGWALRTNWFMSTVRVRFDDIPEPIWVHRRSLRIIEEV